MASMLLARKAIDGEPASGTKKKEDGPQDGFTEQPRSPSTENIKIAKQMNGYLVPLYILNNNNRAKESPPKPAITHCGLFADCMVSIFCSEKGKANPNQKSPAAWEYDNLMRGSLKEYYESWSEAPKTLCSFPPGASAAKIEGALAASNLPAGLFSESELQSAAHVGLKNLALVKSTDGQEQLLVFTYEGGSVKLKDYTAIWKKLRDDGGSMPSGTTATFRYGRNFHPGMEKGDPSHVTVYVGNGVYLDNRDDKKVSVVNFRDKDSAIAFFTSFAWVEKSGIYEPLYDQMRATEKVEITQLEVLGKKASPKQFVDKLFTKFKNEGRRVNYQLLLVEVMRQNPNAKSMDSQCSNMAVELPVPTGAPAPKDEIAFFGNKGAPPRAKAGAGTGESP